MPAGISPRLRSKVLLLLSRKWSQKRIAEHLGIARSSVQRIGQAALGGQRRLPNARRCAGCGGMIDLVPCVACCSARAIKPSTLQRAMRPRVQQLGLRDSERSEYAIVKAEKIARGELPAVFDEHDADHLRSRAFSMRKPDANPPGGAIGSF